MLDSNWWSTLLLPREAVWWAIPLTIALGILFAGALAVIYYPIKIGGELPGGERKSIDRWWLKCLHRFAPLAAIGLLAGTYIQIANLSWPRIVVLSREPSQISPRSSDRAKQQWPGWQQVDARPLVNDALRCVAADGGAAWTSPQPEFVDRVRHHCRETLAEYFQHGLKEPTKASVELPHWIGESLEISTIEALVAYEKCPAAFLDVARGDSDAGWGLAEKTASRELTQFSIEKEPELDAPVARLLFAGTYDPSSGDVRAHALVDADLAGDLSMRIVDLSSRATTLKEFKVAVIKGTGLTPINANILNADRAAKLWLIADRSGVSAPLTIVGGSATAPIRLAMPPAEGENAVQGPLLLRSWRRQLDKTKSQLSVNLERRGQAVAALELALASADDPTLIALPNQRGLLVLAPGMHLNDVPANIYAGDMAPLSHPGTTPDATHTPVPSYGFHAISLEGVADADSLMSVGVQVSPTASQIVLPRTGPGERVLVRGVRPNTTFDSGERAWYPHDKPGGEFAALPILEEGEVDGRQFILLRLSPSLYLTDDGPALGQNAEQDRERAMIATLAAAANRVTRGRTDGSFGEPQRIIRSERGFPVLTTSDLEELRLSAQRRGDALGVLLIGLSLAAIAGQLWLARR